MATRLKLRVCTWNVGNAAPPADLSRWLGISTDTFDIIVIGVQECVYSSEKPVSDKAVTPRGNAPGNVVTRTDSPQTPVRKASGRFRLLSRALKSVRRTLPRSSHTVFENVLSNMSTPTATDVPNMATSLSRNAHDLNDLRRHKTDGTGEKCSMVMNASPRSGALTPVANENQPAESRHPFRRGMSECAFLYPLPADLDESRLVQARVENSRVAPPPLPPFLAAIDDPLSIDDLPTNVSLRIDAASGLPIRPNGRELQSEAHDSISGNRPTADRSPLSSEQSLENTDTDVETDTDVDCSPVHHPRSPTLAALYNLGSPHQRKFERAVTNAMPEGYTLVSKRQMMEMNLLVYVHDRHRDRVEKQEVVAEATGIGNIVGNKGGVAAKITIDGTSFCFINAHLAAHEGKKFREQRHEDVMEIMRSFEKHKSARVPFMHQFDHIFWMGDLNYRLDTAKMIPAAASWPHEARFAYVTRLINEGRLCDLANLDELRHAMAQQEVFTGFAEGPLSFSPTFKVQRGGNGVNTEYQSSRIPSYCDRVLWRSKPMHASHVKQREYNCVPCFVTSDHKPVYATFDVVIPRKVGWLPLSAPAYSHKCTLDFLKLEVHCPSLSRCTKPISSDEEMRISLVGNGALDGWNGTDGSDGSEDLDEPNLVAKRPRGKEYTQRGNEISTAERRGKREGGEIIAALHGDGFFIEKRTYKVRIHPHHSRYASCYDELPCIAVKPVDNLNSLMYKYVTIAFRQGKHRYSSACVLPVASMINGHRHRVTKTLDLTKHGRVIGSVDVDVQLNVCQDGWVDSKGRNVLPLSPKTRHVSGDSSLGYEGRGFFFGTDASD